MCLFLFSLLESVFTQILQIDCESVLKNLPLVFTSVSNRYNRHGSPVPECQWELFTEQSSNR